MINFIKNLITDKTNGDEQTNEFDNEKRVQIATCALFLEVANSDDDFSREEKKFI